MASGTSSPPSVRSARGHVSFDAKPYDVEMTYLSSGEQSPVRGRTLHRTPARDRATSRRRSGALSATATGLDARDLRARLMGRDLTATPEQYYDETMLEPRTPDRLRGYSLSEELHRAASEEGTFGFKQFTGHRDTFALLEVRRLHGNAIYLPDTFFKYFINYLGFDTYKALRLSCRYWSQAITNARPLYLRAANRLPAEILEHIYEELTPLDFNAARRTCRSWMIASLEESLLVRMLQNGGWWKTVGLDMNRLETGFGRRMSTISRNWLLSKRLATECALSAGRHEAKFTEVSQSSEPNLYVNSKHCPLSLTSEIDFSDLAHMKEMLELGDPALRFDVSFCQKHVLVTKAHTIYVYMLQDPYNNPPHEYGGYIQPLNVIQCPQRVLAVSMDTSSDRVSVGALLGDRLGMVFEMRGDRRPSRTPSTPPRSTSYANGSPNGYGPVTDIVAYSTDGSYGVHTFSQYPESINGETGARSIYRNLCSAQDPPKSVAICPQRSCVAFGNATGIEVHWIDARSGQDLQRWYPLSSPCECLYFLPNRIGIDSGRKLRIMASAAHPVQAQIAASQYPSRINSLNKKGPWDDFTSDDQVWKLNWAFSRMSSARRSQTTPEHYDAQPLSDGHAVLFIDPVTNKLTLGGDEKMDTGVPQLTSHFSFEGPAPGMIPYIYTAASELRWGVRVLAGYASGPATHLPKQLWFFSVPPDHFYSDQKYVTGDSNIMAIQGVHIADVSGLSAVAIDATEGDVTFRAFTPEEGGKALTWQLPFDKKMIKKAVLENGVTIPVITSSSVSDVVMEDADGIMTWRRESGFDGAVSPTLRATSQSTVHPLDRRPTSELDADGDTPMLDAPLLPDQPQFPPSPPPEPRTPSPTPPPPLFFANEDEGYGSGDDGYEQAEHNAAGGGFAINAPPIHGSWSGSDEWVPPYLAELGDGIEDKGLGLDVMEATRLELEFIKL